MATLADYHIRLSEFGAAACVISNAARIDDSTAIRAAEACLRGTLSGLIHVAGAETAYQIIQRIADEAGSPILADAFASLTRPMQKEG